MTQNVITVKREFGVRFRSARMAKGLRLKDVADELGVDVRTVAGWQAGRSAPRYEMSTRLAALLEVEPSYLIFGDGK